MRPSLPVFRLLSPADSVTELTDLLHRAYAPLKEMGFRYHATHQDETVTARRASKGECWIGTLEDRLVATVTLLDAARTSGSPWYDRPEVASFGQFAVEPSLQGTGIGSALLDLVEARARERGVKELALDTAEGAAHLIRYYGKRGYRFTEHVQWPLDVVNYRSVVLSKTLPVPSGTIPAPQEIP